MDSRILENWINSALINAEDLDVPGAIRATEAQQPLTILGLDRSSLLTSGISPKDVDRVYKALFVYSVGFNKAIDAIVEHSNKPYSISSAIWKVFAVLLECTCHVDYQMVISQI
jgi:hypothetical protein